MDELRAQAKAAAAEFWKGWVHGGDGTDNRLERAIEAALMKSGAEQERDGWKTIANSDELLDKAKAEARAEGIKACIREIDGGSFLHAKAPDRLWANEVIAMLRRKLLAVQPGEAK